MQIYKPFSFSLLMAALISACSGDRASTEVPAPAVFFPPAEVCGYPAAASAKAISELAAGTWGQVNQSDPGSPYECTGSNKIVRMGTDPNSSIEIGYAATGVEKGASMITLTYSATGSGPIPNESTYRRVFANFVDTVTAQSFGTKPHELFRKKLENLQSYSQTGKGSTENFDIGKGFLQLTRERTADGSEIKVSVKLFPDVALKLAS